MDGEYWCGLYSKSSTRSDAVWWKWETVLAICCSLDDLQLAKLCTGTPASTQNNPSPPTQTDTQISSVWCHCCRICSCLFKVSPEYTAHSWWIRVWGQSPYRWWVINTCTFLPVIFIVSIQLECGSYFCTNKETQTEEIGNIDGLNLTTETSKQNFVNCYCAVCHHLQNNANIVLWSSFLMITGVRELHIQNENVLRSLFIILKY